MLEVLCLPLRDLDDLRIGRQLLRFCEGLHAQKEARIDVGSSHIQSIVSCVVDVSLRLVCLISNISLGCNNSRINCTSISMQYWLLESSLFLSISGCFLSQNMLSFCPWLKSLHFWCLFAAIFRSFDDGSRRRTNRYHIFQKIRMSCFFEIISEDSVSLVSLGLTFEAIKCPIRPINISFLQVSNEIIPRDIFAVVAVFS